MKTTKIRMQLTNECIGEAVNTIEGWLGELELQRRDLLALSLSMEETMLRWQDRFGGEKEFELIKCSRLGQPYLLLSLAGEEYDPLDEQEQELDWSKQLMVEMGLAPEFRYSKGNNEVWIKLKKAKAGAFFKIFVAGAIAIVLGALGKFLFPELAATIQAALIKPLREAFLGLLTATAGPLVFPLGDAGRLRHGKPQRLWKAGQKHHRPLYPHFAAVQCDILRGCTALLFSQL